MSDTDLETVHADEYYAMGFEMLELLEDCALQPVSVAVAHELAVASDIGVRVAGHESVIEGHIASWEPSEYAMEQMTDLDWQTLAEWRRELLARA